MYTVTVWMSVTLTRHHYVSVEADVCEILNQRFEANMDQLIWKKNNQSYGSTRLIVNIVIAVYVIVF